VRLLAVMALSGLPETTSLQYARTQTLKKRKPHRWRKTETSHKFYRKKKRKENDKAKRANLDKAVRSKRNF